MWNLDLNAFYFHSLILGKDEALGVFDSVLKQGKILSLSKGAYDTKHLRMNTDDEICLSKVCNLNLVANAYDLFVKKKMSFIIKGNIPGVYSPQIVPEEWSMDYVSKGVTDLHGEYRIKNEIPLDYVIGINIPANFIISSMFGYKYFFSAGENLGKFGFVREEKRINDTVEFYNNIKSIMDKYNIDLPIYDIDDKRQLVDSDDIVKIKKKDKFLDLIKF